MKPTRNWSNLIQKKVKIPPLPRIQNEMKLPVEEQILWRSRGPYYFVYPWDAHKLKPRSPSSPYNSPCTIYNILNPEASELYHTVKHEALNLPKSYKSPTSPKSPKAKTPPSQEVLNIMAQAKLPEGTVQTSGPKWFMEGLSQEYDPNMFQLEQGAQTFKLGDKYFINREDIGLLAKVATSKPASTSTEEQKATEGLSKIVAKEPKSPKKSPGRTPAVQKRASPKSPKKTPFGPDYEELDISHYKITHVVKKDESTGKYYIPKDATKTIKSSPRRGSHKKKHQTPSK